MERFSNSYGDLHNELKIELFTLDLSVEEECIVKYVEFPYLGGG